MSQSYGPTSIIDQCESAHQLQPPLAFTSNSSSTVVLSVDSDEEQQLLDRSSDDTASRPSSSSMQMLVQPPLETRSNSFNLMHQNSYGSLRYRTNPATSPLLEHFPPESIRFQVVVWDVGPVDVALGRVPMTFRLTMFWDDEEHKKKPCLLR